MSPEIRERLIEKARLSFSKCNTPFTNSSEFRSLIRNHDGLPPLKHLEAIFNKFKKNKKSCAGQSTTNTAKKDDETPVDAGASESYNKDLFEKFLDIIKERKNSQGKFAKTETMMVRAWDLYNNCKSSYKKSALFEELLRKAINLSAVDPGMQLLTVLDELKFNKKVVSQRECTNLDAQPGCSTASTPTLQDVDSDDDDLSGLDPQVKKKVKLLERTLRALNLRIKHLEEREVDFSREDDENSAYIKLDKYYQRFEKVYAKICQLKKQKADAGRAIKRKITFEGGEIERALEKHYNKTYQFPDFHDVLKITKEVRRNDNLAPNTLHSIAQRVFEEFGKMLQRRRRMDVYESACAYLTIQDPADEDPQLQKKLEENYIKFKESEKKVIDMYVEKSQGIEAEEVGSDVSNNEEAEDDEMDDDRRDSDKSDHDLIGSEKDLNLMSGDDDDDDDDDDRDKLVSNHSESNSGNSSDPSSTKNKKVTKIQCEKVRFVSEASNENKTDSTSGNSLSVCASRDSILPKDSETVNISEKERDILSLNEDESGDEVKSVKSANVESSSRDVVVAEVTTLEKIKSPKKDEKTESGMKNCVASDVEKKESCSLSPSKEEKKTESRIRVSENLFPKNEIFEASKTCSFDKNKSSSSTCTDSTDNNIVTFPTESQNGCSNEILVSKDCKSRNLNKNSSSLASEKNKKGKTDTDPQITSQNKSIPLEVIDKSSYSSKNNDPGVAKKKRKKSCETATDDQKRQKHPDHHTSLVVESPCSSPTDDIEVIEVLTHSASFTNKENVTTTHLLTTDSDEQKKSNPNSAINCAKKIADDNNGATKVSSYFAKSNATCGAIKVTGVNSNLPGSIAHSFQKTPPSNKAFKNNCKNSSSPIITSAYSLAFPYSSKHNGASTIPAHGHKIPATTSWSAAAAKYRSPRASNHQKDLKSSAKTHNSRHIGGHSSSSVSSASTSKLKDVIVIDEGDDDSPDVFYVSEVMAKNKNPANAESSKPRTAKLLDGNIIKYISGEKTQHMLKQGNVKVFSRLKTNPPSEDAKDSVITLD
ncbi:uncharacterized protein LOC111062224 isoform X2 [Nilaparvata lugens]|nr:uncharacterized protein LOC111062224 isoform X2 [Nilaparvata lugens]